MSLYLKSAQLAIYCREKNNENLWNKFQIMTYQQQFLLDQEDQWEWDSPLQPKEIVRFPGIDLLRFLMSI